MNKRQKKKIAKIINERFEYMNNLDIISARRWGKINMQTNLMRIVLAKEYRLFKNLKKNVDKVMK